MTVRLVPKLVVSVVLLGCAGGCPSSEDDENAMGGTVSGSGTGSPGSDTDPGTDADTDPDADPVCEPAPECEGEEPGLRGWVSGGDGPPMTIFLSSPATACGDRDPAMCTECGDYESVEIILPAAAQAPGTYTEADITMNCASWVSDCMGNGGGEGSAEPGFTVEILSIDEGCVVGEIIDTTLCSTSGGRFAVSRC